jgi:hypothetical protein
MPCRTLRHRGHSTSGARRPHRASGSAVESRAKVTLSTGYQRPTFAGSLLQTFATTFPKITQPHLKPSFFGPLPILGHETVAVIWTVVNFALDENKLPQTHDRCSLNFLIIFDLNCFLFVISSTTVFVTVLPRSVSLDSIDESAICGASTLIRASRQQNRTQSQLRQAPVPRLARLHGRASQFQ